MNNQQRESIRQRILTRINEIEGLLSATREDVDLDDESANLEQKIASAVDSQVIENEKRELTRLKNNLPWVESEDAGYCQRCDREIPFSRLMAVPTTRLCVACAQ